MDGPTIRPLLLVCLGIIIGLLGSIAVNVSIIANAVVNAART